MGIGKYQKNIKGEKTRKGLTLIEMMVTLFVFTLILLSVMGVASVYLRNRFLVRNYQQSMEEMSLSINEMAKFLRMANCDTACSLSNGTQEQITVVKNSDGEQLSYKFDNVNNVLKVGVGVSVPNTTIMENINGRFYVDSGDLSGKELPRITITMWKPDMPQAVIQTTISMRGSYEIEYPE